MQKKWLALLLSAGLISVWAAIPASAQVPIPRRGGPGGQGGGPQLGNIVIVTEDLVLADFEGPDYGAWKAEGQAFGTGPVHGQLPHQQEVSGYAKAPDW